MCGDRSQTFCDYECVVVDDGSTDDTLAILQRWAEDDARLRILSRPNTGMIEKVIRQDRARQGGG